MNKRRNMVILMCIILAGIVCGTLVRLSSEKEGTYAVIEVDGSEQARLYLDQDTEIRVGDGQQGYNVVRVRNGRIFVSEADCPDQICVREGGKSKNKEVIACLPHKMIIMVRSELDDAGKKTDASAW